MDGGDPRPRRRASAPSTSRCTTSPARSSACPSTSCSACPRICRRPTSRSASTRPTSSPSAPRRAADFPALKIKVGGPEDLATLEAVRGVFDGPIRVDANTGWTPEEAVALLPDLERLGVELIEQPFPARPPRPASLAPGAVVAADRRRRELRLRARTSTRSSASSPASTSSSPSAAGSGPARRMLERARELGFRTFLGCMEETSVGIAGSAAVASLADWVDLDGCLLLADDPFEGLELAPDHRWRLAQRPGLGLSRAAGRPEPVHARSAQAFGERPFMWITWWTKSWTSPLPGRRRSAYDGRSPAGDHGGDRR